MTSLSLRLRWNYKPGLEAVIAAAIVSSLALVQEVTAEAAGNDNGTRAPHDEKKERGKVAHDQRRPCSMMTEL